MALFSCPAGSYDLGLHLRLGEEIALAGSIPRTDLHSYTAQGAPFLAHEWLCQLLFHAVHRAFGMSGISLLAAAGAAAAFLLLLTALDRGTDRRLGILILLGILPLALSHFGARPHVLGWAVLALFLTGLARGWRWRLLLLLGLWANLHGSVLLGMGLGALHFLERFAASRRRDELAWGLACLAAPLANPYGIRLYTHVFEIRGAAAFLTEWKPWTPGDAYFWIWTAFLLLLAGRLLRTRGTLFDAIRLLALAVLGYSARRHTLLAALCLAPLQARLWAPVWPLLATRLGRWLDAALAGILLLGLAHQVRGHHAGRLGLDTRPLPVAATEFLMRPDGIEGRVFNDYNFGGWMLWRAWPRFQVFLDGRTDLYRRGPIAECLAVSRAEPGWEALLAHYRISTVFVRKDRPLARVLRDHPGWELAYFDDLAVIYVARGTSPQVPRLRVATPWGPRDPGRLAEYRDELSTLLAWNEEAADHRINLALVLERLGDLEGARREAARYLSLGPEGDGSPEADALLARLGLR